MNFVLREEFALMFQTFSRTDPPGKAPPSRGRSVFKFNVFAFFSKISLCVNFMLREEFALMFQTFSRIDPSGKAPRRGAVLL